MKCEHCPYIIKTSYEYSEYECPFFGEGYVPKGLDVAYEDGCRLTKKEAEQLYELWIKFSPYPVAEEHAKQNEIAYKKYNKKLDQLIKKHTVVRNCMDCYWGTDEGCYAFFDGVIPEELEADVGCGCRLNKRELCKLSRLIEEAEDKEYQDPDVAYEKYDKYIEELIERKGKSRRYDNY